LRELAAWPGHKQDTALDAFLQLIVTLAISACVDGFDVALERAADALHCANSNAKPRGYLAHAFCAARGLQSVVDSLFQLGGYWSGQGSGLQSRPA
jgi:hypothetical protein